MIPQTGSFSSALEALIASGFRSTIMLPQDLEMEVTGEDTPNSEDLDMVRWEWSLHKQLASILMEPKHLVTSQTI